ncbi:hypothetical protein CJ179_37980 [Rhodococcus sp. ACS1]|uniref:IS3 family transposase n=1 Tax=Rhodococcus sp. ACS1 TaxID=2028570 RepID=UPI000BB15DAF|nr:hypothetical protein CJ179_37980 [Rhodococcus sp. ACS1]
MWTAHLPRAGLDVNVVMDNGSTNKTPVVERLDEVAAEVWIPATSLTHWTVPRERSAPNSRYTSADSFDVYGVPLSLLNRIPFNSGKGCQFTAVRFTQRLVDAGIAPSTGSVGDSFDNALAENLWSTLKIELIYWPAKIFATRAEAEAALFRYIDGWYNPRRIQAGLRGLSPDEYERAYYDRPDGQETDIIEPELVGAR